MGLRSCAREDSVIDGRITGVRNGESHKRRPELSRRAWCPARGEQFPKPEPLGRGVRAGHYLVSANYLERGWIRAPLDQREPGTNSAPARFCFSI